LIELASRESAGLRVRLLWGEGTGVVTVSVDNAGTGERFELAVADRDPLDVYHHPYAYAGWREHTAASRTRA
jgi:hypothetical protein